MTKHLLSLCAAFFLCTMISTAHAQTASGPFADVPLGSWPYAAVDIMQKAGIVISNPDGTSGRVTFGRVTLTRLQFAISIARLVALLPQVDVMPKPEHLDELRADLRKRLVQNTKALAALGDLVETFTPELKLLKPPYGTTIAFDVDDVKESLVALAARPAYPSVGPVRPPFTDVPRDHWAYQSVETLRKLGIVGGYPGGAYQTGRG